MEYDFTAPDGTKHITNNLRQFCRDHSLDSGNMTRVFYGLRRHHKGWTCESAGYVRKYERRSAA